MAAASLVFGVGVAAALVLVYAVVLGPTFAGTSPLLAGFEARSYPAGQTATLRITGGGTSKATLQLYLAGAPVEPGTASLGWDRTTFGRAVTVPRQVRRPRGAWLVHVQLGSGWPSGDYVARLTWPGHTDYAPFVIRPRKLGTEGVLVVEPTNTWQAYNVTDGDSWYLSPAVHLIHLDRPFAGTDVRGGRVPTGLPEQFWRFDLGFLRWYWRSGYQADFVSDDDLERISHVGQLNRYRLIVFAGHEIRRGPRLPPDRGLPGQRRQPRLSRPTTSSTPCAPATTRSGGGCGGATSAGPRQRSSASSTTAGISAAIPTGRTASSTPRPQRGSSPAPTSTTAASSAGTGSRSTSRATRRRRRPVFSR